MYDFPQAPQQSLYNLFLLPGAKNQLINDFVQTYKHLLLIIIQAIK